MRVALAAVLFLEPDLLLLDEPTNHLDLEAAMWLEEHLRRYPRTLLLISHDRDFLNAVPEKICHLEGRRLTVYQGGYDPFERQRREKLILLEKARARQEQERARIQAFVDRFRYKASKARQAQSRIKMLERLQPIAQALIEPEIRFSFPAGGIPAPPLVTMEAARVGYGEKVVLDRLSLRLDPEDRIAFLGRNGNGKSTLAKLIAGRLALMAGELTRARGLKVGFFAQHQIEDLEPEQTPIRHLQARRPLASEQQIRGHLARFGLGQERAETCAKHLSGGEKTRLCFTLMCLDEPQLLILDEPTNHLDIDSREALVEAVNDFAGAVIVISHDRHLVELVADSLWLVADGRVKPYEGDLDDYRRLLLETSAEPAAPVAEKPKTDRRSAGERRSLLAPLRQRAKEAEREVERLGTERARIEARLADPASYGNGTDIGALQRRLAELASLTEAAETRWLEAEAEIERVEAA
jgi:ATP-binding cassette subfamily F protein 3